MQHLHKPTRLMGAIAIITTAFALAGVPAQAGAAPSDQPLRIVVPYAPGGTGDVIARLVAKKLGEQSGQSVVVENKPGAAGSIGASTVARAAADGNTLLLGYTSEMVINPIVQKGVSYDVARDFAPVAMAGSTPLLLVANPTVGANSIAELVALAKAKPNRLSYASAGPGSPAHIAGALLAREAGIQLLHVPYKGGSQAVTDTVGGVVSIYFSGMPPAVPFVKNGKLTALGVTARQPSPALPDVPALAAQDYPRVDLAGWFGFFAPREVPAPVQAALHDRITAALAADDIRQALAVQGVETRPMSAQAFGGFVAAEQKKYARFIDELGIAAE
ncbi:tripartite tricarboxylate transporter substrate binding protein [Bordetella bronchiseptica]|uniref:tripartite tricarboxylate transporter substrate binding protein n=1 Tax=Bordetella bronchiseptica TaxID=518 RepID=UPI0005283AAC|nr:tripartite tricarboxylate transporter substrate binding protein [Bordetella bronchiseptica]